VALFYTTEDKEHQIIVLTSGEVEKYGYPGTPGLAEMEKNMASAGDDDSQNGYCR